MEDGIRQSTVGCTLNAQITTRVLPNSSSVYPCIAQFHPVKTRYFTSNHVDCLESFQLLSEILLKITLKKSGINSNPKYRTRISGIREVDGTQPSSFATKSKETYLKNSEGTQPSGFATKSEEKYLKNSEDFSSSEDGISDYESKLNQVVEKEPSKSAGPVTRSNSKYQAKISATKQEVQPLRSGHLTESKGKCLEYSESSSEDSISDYEQELKQVVRSPSARSSGYDTRSKKKAEKKIKERSSVDSCQKFVPVSEPVGSSSCDPRSEKKKKSLKKSSTEESLQKFINVPVSEPVGSSSCDPGSKKKKKSLKKSAVEDYSTHEIDDVPLLRKTIKNHFYRFLFDLYKLFDAEGLLKTGLYDKVEPLTGYFLDGLFEEMDQIV